MFESRDTRNESQPQFWIEARRLPKATASTFYRKLDATLESIGFTAGVREICRPAYADAAKGGYIVGSAHLSFPGLGRLRAEGAGYVFVPVNYSPPAK